MFEPLLYLYWRIEPHPRMCGDFRGFRGFVIFVYFHLQLYVVGVASIVFMARPVPVLNNSSRGVLYVMFTSTWFLGKITIACLFVCLHRDVLVGCWQKFSQWPTLRAELLLR
jgi:hypothetical protein